MALESSSVHVGISFDSIGNVYIADRDNSCIQVFSNKGKFLRIVEDKKGMLKWPVGVAVHPNGVTFVSELYKNRITVFDRKGHLLSSKEGFARPIDLAVDDSGVLYVCEYDRNCVIMF